MSRFLDDDNHNRGQESGNSIPRAATIFQRLTLKPGKATGGSKPGGSGGSQGAGGGKSHRSSRSTEEDMLGGRRRSGDATFGLGQAWVASKAAGGSHTTLVPGHLKMKSRGAPDGDRVSSQPHVGLGSMTAIGSRNNGNPASSTGHGPISRLLQRSGSSELSTSSGLSSLMRTASKEGAKELNIDLTSEGEGTEPRAVIPSGSSDADESSSTTDEDDDERMGGEPLAGLAHVAPSVSAPAMVVEPARPPPPPAPKTYAERKLDELLAEDVVNLQRLRELSWGGVPRRYRREATLKRKRREYSDLLPMYFNIPPEDRTLQEQEILRQILVDLPRTQPDMPLFHQDSLQRCMQRILYVWAIRHPASGYVQGMNDLITPLLLVFIGDHLEKMEGPSSVEAFDVSRLPEETLHQVEADVYWCTTKLLDNIQDHYTFSQPGLQRMIFRLSGLVERHDRNLHNHLEAEGIQYVQFSFRWMNCLLMRELSLSAIIRCWDTELSEDNGFEVFHVYLCAAFLMRFSEHLRTLQFQDLVLFLQDPPTRDWSLSEDVEPLLSQAHVLRSLYPA